MFNKISTHIEDAKNRQVQVFRQENMDKLVSVFADRFQKLENVFYDVLTKTAISTSEGIQLDRISEVYGGKAPRNGRNDDLYRAFLKNFIFTLKQAGQHNVLMDAFQNLSGATKVKHFYSYPAHVSLIAVVDTYDDLLLEENKLEMNRIRAAGVSLDVGYQLSSGFFQFSEFPSGAVPAGSGFADNPSGTNGGTLNLLS